MTDRPTLEELDAEPEQTPWCCSGNAEDCALCTDPNPPYPFICPGHPLTNDNERRVRAATEATDVCQHCKHPADWHDQHEGCVGPNGIGGIGSGDCTCTRNPETAPRPLDGETEPAPAEPTVPGPDPRQPAYDAVYAYLRRLEDRMPADPVHRNAIIWRAANAALDASRPTLASSYDPEALRQRLFNTILDWTATGPTISVDGCVSRVLAVVQPELDRLADYENRITWETSCGSCARILDSSIRETERAERAEARVRELEAALAEHQPKEEQP
ncbi:hypothetical protein ACWEP4_42895 [Streptomyces sp. NPDC004227]